MYPELQIIGFPAFILNGTTSKLQLELLLRIISRVLQYNECNVILCLTNRNIANMFYVVSAY